MSKYNHLTGSFATNLNSSDGIDSINATISKICVYPNYPHTGAILDHVYNGLAVRAHRIYNYARDTYTLGLPNGYEIYLNTVPDEDVQAVIEAEVGYPITTSVVKLGEPDALLAAYAYAKDNWGWYQATNTFTNPPIYYTGSIDIDSAYFDGDGTLRVIFVVTDSGPSDVYKTVRVYDHAYLLNNLYYQVVYRETDKLTNSNDSYWFYRNGEGTHPTLDTDTQVEFGSPFMPVIPLREDNISLGPECLDGEYVLDGDGNKIVPDTDLYRTSVKLCKLAGTDINELTRELSNNPDISEVDHAYLIFGIDLRTETETSKHYLYQFFNNIVTETFDNNDIVITDSKYNIKISFDSITKTVHQGVLAGTELTFTGSDVTIKHQTDDTSYTELTIVNLVHTNYVEGRHAVVTSVSDSGSEDNYNFIIPLRYDAIKENRSMMDREILLKESLKLVFNSYERIKLKWYQTSIFKTILTIVAVAVAVWTAGAGLAALSTMTAAEAAAAIATTALYSTLITVGFKILGSMLPAELAVILAIVAVVVTAFAGFSGNDFASLNSVDLIQLSSNLNIMAQSSIGTEMQDIMDDASEFTAYAKEMDEDLALLEEAVEIDTLFDVTESILYQPIFIEGETSSEFYDRTIHTGNIGVLALDIIESYVDIKLTLPSK